MHPVHEFPVRPMPRGHCAAKCLAAECAMIKDGIHSRLVSESPKPKS